MHCGNPVKPPLEIALICNNRDTGDTTDYVDYIAPALKKITAASKPRDRICVYNLGGGTSGEDVVREYDLTRMFSKTAVNSVIDNDIDYSAWNALWDSIGDAATYLLANKRPGSVPVIVCQTQYDDWGTNGRETGSETYCPGSDEELHSTETWGTKDQYNVTWGQPSHQYLDEWGVAGRDLYRRTSSTGGVYINLNIAHDTRYGLLYCPIWIYFLGTGTIMGNWLTYTSGSDTAPSGTVSTFTTLYDMWKLSNNCFGSHQGFISLAKCYFRSDPADIGTDADNLVTQLWKV